VSLLSAFRRIHTTRPPMSPILQDESLEHLDRLSPHLAPAGRHFAGHYQLVCHLPSTTGINANAGISLSHFRTRCIRPDSDRFLSHSPWVSLPLMGVLQAQYWLSTNSSCSPRLWAKRLSSQLLNITHGMWLFRNQQLQEYQQMSLTTTTASMIRQEFALGINDLLPQDQFYVLPSTMTDGFSLDHVLNMPLPDQQLWLSAVRSARARGSQLSQAEISAMQSNLRHWLQAPPSSLS